MSRQRSAPSATLAQLAELTSGRRQACELADADSFSTFCNMNESIYSHNEPGTLISLALVFDETLLLGIRIFIVAMSVDRL
jgi:hypothetical protein